MEDRQANGTIAPTGLPPRAASGARPPPRPPAPAPARPMGSGPLSSYVSEPPSTLALMKTYAQELMQNGIAEQPQQEAGAAAAAGATLPSPPPSIVTHPHSGIELPKLSASDRALLDRPLHFQLGPTVGTPRRRKPATDSSARAAPGTPTHARLRSSIGWFAAGSPPGAGQVVLEHRLAGDLIMPAATIRAAAGASGPASPARDVRRRPIVRASLASVGEGASSPTKKPVAQEDEGKADDLESLDFEGSNKPWWKKKTLWIIVVPIVVALAFVLAGVLYLEYGSNQRVGEFQLWRLCFFIAGLVVIYWIGRGFMDLVVWGVERTLFTWKNALYYCYAVRRPMANVIRAALTTGWWALIMTAFSGDMNSTLKAWYQNVLRVFGCLTLFMTANLLKVLFAKMLASKFNQVSHYQKMHDALNREYLLHLMLQPLQRYTEFANLDDEGWQEGTMEDGDEGSPPARAHSAPLTTLHRPSKQNTLVRLFRLSGKPQAKGRRIPPERKTSLKDKVLFWRSSKQNLQAIAESEEGEDGRGSSDSGGKGGLPPDAVAVDIGGSKHGGGALSSNHDALPLDSQGGSLKLPPGLLPMAGDHAVPSSVPASPAKPLQPASSRPPASPPTKLARLRSDALEAVRGEGGGLRSPRAGAGLYHQASLARSQAGQAGEGSGRGGARGPRAISVQRSGSMASVRTAQPAAARAPPLQPKKPVLNHAASSISSSTTNRHLMALRMSKMEKYIRKHALEVTFKDVLSRSERSETVTNELEAKKLGFYLFHNVKADLDREHIIIDDLEDFMSEKDAKAAFDMLDADGNGRVNVQECCAAIARVFVERRNLAASLRDARTIVGTLESLIGVALHLFMVFIYLVIWNVDVMKTWAGFASIFLGMSFIFGNSIRTTYENVVFLFLVHPYDVGDFVFIDQQQCKVEEIHMSYTVFCNPFNQRLWYPNEKIRAIYFVNMSTSGNKGELFRVLVDLDTPPAVLDEVRAAGEAVIRAHPKEFSGTLAVNLSAAGDPLKMALVVYWEFSHSGADGGRAGRARTTMFQALSEALTRVHVRYTWPSTADSGRPSLQAAVASGEARDAALSAAKLL